MKDLKDTVLKLQSNDVANADYGLLEEIYKGRARTRPYKVLNPDPNIQYDGEVFEICRDDGKYIFHFVRDKDTVKTTGKVKSISAGFDIMDSHSPLESKRREGRFSFQYNDTEMPKNKPNYRRILFFFADNTTPKRINDYFKGGRKISFDERGFYILCQTNENGNPSGLAYIYNYCNGTYYFVDFNDGELEGFAFAFTASGGSYVFKDAFMMHNGKKIDLYASVIDDIKKAKQLGNQTVISWS